MGSFYATCSITDLSITDGDQMYMQLILPSWVNNPHSIDGEQIGCGEKGLRVANEGPLGEFVPFGFPIAGHYADYGDIDGIVKDRNIEMLEEFFNIPIQDIISCATDDRWYKHSYLPAIIEKKEEEYEGAWKSWTVGKNKMVNVEILKKLTVTYFRKEHYDYLSQNSLLTDDHYYEKERVKRLEKMVEKLSHLDSERPKESKPDFTKNDITDKIRERFIKVFGKEGSSDESIIEIQNHKDEQWWYPFQYTFYIPSIARVNMFQKLPIGPEDVEQVMLQYRFITNMGNLYKVLRPSYYGSQDDNFKAYVKFHKMTTELVDETRLKMKADTVLFVVSDILKRRLKGINNQETIDAIKNDITGDLSDYGYTINL